MAITTAPTAGMKTAIKNEFVNQFGGGSPPTTEAAIATAMAEVVAIAIEQALIEIKTNAIAKNGTAGGDDIDID